MKSLKKGFLMLTSVAMAVGALLIGGGIKETQEVKAAETWALVTDASTLNEGDKIVIASNTKGFVAGNITNQYMKNVEATFDSSTNTLSSLPADAVPLTLGGSAGAWTLANANGELLGATAVKKLAWDDGTTTWSISIDSDYNATIQNGNSKYGRFIYNSGSPRFAPYTSGTTKAMLLPQIYRCTIVNKEYTVSFVDSDKTTKLSEPQIANEGNNYMITEPTVTKEGYTFGGWYLEESQTPILWDFNNPVEKDMTLVAHWDDATLANAKDALNNVTSYMSYGFKYDVTSTKYGCYSVNSIEEKLDGKSVVVVGGIDGKYYAMNNELNAIEVKLTDTKMLDLRTCFDKIKSKSITWTAIASTDGTYNLKNASGQFINTGSKTALSVGRKATTKYKIDPHHNKNYYF